MRLLEKRTFLPIIFTMIFINGCASSTQTIYTSEAHPYDNNFGIVPDPELDASIEQEYLAQNESAEVDYSNLDPTLTTELVVDPDAVTLEEYVEPEPIITYKYMQSPIFFKEDELPENKLMIGSAILNHPSKSSSLE